MPAQQTEVPDLVLLRLDTEGLAKLDVGREFLRRLPHTEERFVGRVSRSIASPGEGHNSSWDEKLPCGRSSFAIGDLSDASLRS